jgi:two-component system OmpR family sensor kinase
VTTLAIALRGARWPYRLGVDVLVVAGLCAVTAVLLGSAPVRAVLPVGPTYQLLTLGAAAVGAGAAILAVVVSRLLGEPRASWVAAALVLYCAVVLPWTTVAPSELDLGQRAGRLVAYLTALVLLAAALRPPAALGAWGGWVVMAAGGGLALGVLALPEPVAVSWLVEGPVATVGVLVGWTGAAVGFAAEGLRRQSTARLRLGLGLIVLAVAQLYRVAAGEPLTATTNLSFAALRFVGLAVVLVALAQLVRAAVHQLRSDQWHQQEELAVAALHMERAGELAAERDHELRNGLAGLAGITHLLGSDTGDPEHERIRQAVLAELRRLRTILDGADASRDAAPYLVEPVLTGLVSLRPPGRTPVAVHVEPGAVACGDSAVLAQVVTNLLANCDRHAPGAPVALTAQRQGETVVVEVRDAGPGLPPGREDAVLERGVRDESAGGTGLGLHISRQLVAREGGTLTVRTADSPRGCVATVTMPAAPDAPVGSSQDAPGAEGEHSV